MNTLMNGNKKIAINSIIIYIRLIIVSIISIILSRVVLDALGASDYGLYNVVGGIVLLLNIINSSMTSTTYRYLAFELGKGDYGNPNKIFNTSLIIHCCFALLIILVGDPIGEIYIKNYLNVQQDSIADAQFVFRLSIIAAAVNTVFIPNQGLLVAYEKFYANAIIDIFSNIFKLALIVLFIYSDGNRLRLYSIFMAAGSILSSILYWGYCKWRHNDVVHFRFSRDKHLYKEMLSFSGWTMYGAAANVGKNQGSAIIINYFFGTVVNAAYAIAYQVESFIMIFARSLGSAAVPQTTKSYSHGDYERAINLTSYISKYTFLLMAFISFPIILEMDFILNIWLKDVPEGTGTFCKLITLGNLIGCLGEGIPNLINACGKIKAYQIVVHTILLAGLPISIGLYALGYNMYTICIVYCIINFINSFVKLIMLHRVVNFQYWSFMKVSHFRIAMVSVPLLIIYLIYEPATTNIGSCLGITGSVIVYVVIVYLLGIDANERNKFNSYVKKLIIR